ncbi:MAG: hypothetical protein IPO63_13165 [Bacteroidetes bacterium]|nr:hypothetical protein [Bacteroidota bacterium]
MKSKLYKIIILFIVFSFKITSSTILFDWVKAFNGTSTSSLYAIEEDRNGDIYVSGSYSGTMDIDPGPGTQNSTAVGQSDFFIAKLDPAGNLI